MAIRLSLAYLCLAPTCLFWTPLSQFFQKQKAKLEFFFVLLNAQIGVYCDRNGESNDWQVGVLFFCCLSSPLCAGIKVLTALLWSLDEDQRAYWQLSLVQRQPSTPDCCLYANAGLCQSHVTDSLSVLLLFVHSRLHVNFNSNSVWHKPHLVTCDDVVSGASMRSWYLLNLVYQQRSIDYKIYFTVASGEL